MTLTLSLSLSLTLTLTLTLILTLTLASTLTPTLRFNPNQAPTDPWLRFLREHRLRPTGEPEK